ncbi:AraC family transcriptional regulator [Pseudonocardia sp.]|jgi:AraC-like DNA-binding protein|uniref:AraC family transcriptional regulator n=1 Tax=Pseudonocardia sp. TaxID=60912 RepID=UPI0031FCCC54
MLPEFFSNREVGIDKAQAAVEETYYLITSMGLIDRRAMYEFHLEGVALGALSVSKAWYNAGIQVAMDDLQSCYYINFPETGGMQTDHHQRSVEIAPGCAAVYQPIGDVRMRTSGDYSSYAVRIGCAALEDTLAAHLGRTVTRPLALGACLDLTRPAGANWARLVRLLATEALAHRATRHTALTNPLIAAPLHEAVLVGLLQAADHPDRETLEHSVRAWGIGPVQRAIDAMHAYPDQPLTLTRLAQIAGCSVRSLQEGFRRYVGLTPLQYLRQVRLEHAHHDLTNADLAHSSVTDIASRWGFTHLGRFATTYRAKYGRSPSQTLRRRIPTHAISAGFQYSSSS